MYCYTVDGINFESLPPEKQEEKMGEWLDLLRSLPEDCELLVSFSRKPIPLTIDGKNTSRLIEQVSIGTTEPISGILEALNFDATLEESMPEIDVYDESFGCLKRENGLSKIYVLYDMPAKLPWGWIRSIFGSCHHVKMWVKSIEKDAALKMMFKKQAILASSANSNHRAMTEYTNAVNTEAGLIDGATRLFEMSMVCVVNADNRKDLKERCKAFERAARMSSASFDAVKGKQGAAYHGEWRMRLLSDLSLFTIMYPFHSAEMMETPSGVILGVNLATKGPVIYDIVKRANGNVVVIGASGFGKSFFVKLFLKRMIERILGIEMSSESELAMFIVDPMNEYYRHRDYYGLDGILITGDEELGLDPIKMLKPAEAASMLSLITHADQTSANEIMRYIETVDSVDALYKVVSPHTQESIQHLVDGPLAKAMRGTTKFSDRMVISMRGMTKQSHQIVTLLLVINKIWHRVIELPESQPKIIVIDEGWLLAEIPESMDYIEQIVRMGRKLNVKFVFITQTVDDISKSHGAEGKLIDNMGTKVLMKLEDDAAKSAMEVMGLSEYEKRSIIKFSKGEGLMLTEHHRVMVKFEATAKETEVYFNTKAGGA